MRKLSRALGVAGILAASLVFSGPAFGQSQMGQVGGSSGGLGGGSSGGGGGGGSGRGGSGSGTGQLGSGATQPTSIQGESLLGSFNNVGSGGRGSTTMISPTNLFSTTYVNPYQQGLLVSNGQTFTPVSTAGFGQPVFGTIMTGGTSGSRSSFGSTGANTGLGRTGTGFGGTSVGGMQSFGSSGFGATSTGLGSSGFGSGGLGSSGLGGSASLRSGTGMTFTGGNYGPAIGRTGPTVGATLAFAPAGMPPAVGPRTDLQTIVSRSSAIHAPAGVQIGMDSNVVVLRGTVASPDERRLVENMIRLQPGVHEVRNELAIQGIGP